MHIQIIFIISNVYYVGLWLIIHNSTTDVGNTNAGNKVCPVQHAVNQLRVHFVAQHTSSRKHLLCFN